VCADSQLATWTCYPTRPDWPTEGTLSISAKAHNQQSLHKNTHHRHTQRHNVHRRVSAVIDINNDTDTIHSRTHSRRSFLSLRNWLDINLQCHRHRAELKKHFYPLLPYSLCHTHGDRHTHAHTYTHFCSVWYLLKASSKNNERWRWLENQAKKKPAQNTKKYLKRSVVRVYVKLVISVSFSLSLSLSGCTTPHTNWRSELQPVCVLVLACMCVCVCVGVCVCVVCVCV